MEYCNYEKLKICVERERMGYDLCILIFGGDQPHIGCIAVGEPRESLSGNGKRSATVSVYNFLGHKDDEVAKPVAYEVASRLGCRVAVVCGVHYENADPELFEQVQQLTSQITEDICQLERS